MPVRPAPQPTHRLPPGQRRIEGFPRFGTHLHRPPPPTPDAPALVISGPVVRPATIPLEELQMLPRVDVTADFHCVSGWTATDVAWSGIAFPDFYRAHIAPRITPGATPTHLVFIGSDGYRAVACLDDVLVDHVLLADRLDGRPLPPEHGAPLRLVSPDQYGFVSAKHLAEIEVHPNMPQENFGAASALARVGFRLPLFRRHPHARVWHEERHLYLPGPLLRPVYRLLIRPLRALSAGATRNDHQDRQDS